jgi:hypothetical protein
MNRTTQPSFDFTSEERTAVEDVRSLLVEEMPSGNRSGKILAIR